MNAQSPLRLLALALLTVAVTVPALKAQTTQSEIQLGASCTTSECHTDLEEQPFTHGPVNLGQCAPCHQPQNNQHVFEMPPTPAGRDLCLVCHYQEPDKQSVHAPYSTDCMLCHDPHGGDNRMFVKGGLGAESCNRCHSDVLQDISRPHGPVALGECLVCHDPHQSDHAPLLVEPRATLCQSCHVDVAQTLETAVSTHEPVSQDCAGCHNAHGGQREYFLTAEPQDLCMQCHESFIEQMDQFEHQHQPMTEGKGCVQCHQPHASQQLALLADNNMQLCLSCHNQTIQSDGQPLHNIQNEIQQAEFLHGPLREDNCIACHEAHGSDHPRILDKAFPADFYTAWAPEKYDLCFSCHDRQIVLEEESTVTAFRNGEQNLHYLHVNREKGRSCRACHHEHASSQSKHIRSEVPFGNWMMKVDFTPTESGGTCSTGCHLPYRYDRESPIDNQQVAMP